MRRHDWWKEVERHYTDKWLHAYFPGFVSKLVEVVKTEQDGDERVILDVLGTTIVIEKKKCMGTIFWFMLNWAGNYTIVCSSIIDVAKTLMTVATTLKYVKEVQDGMPK